MEYVVCHLVRAGGKTLRAAKLVVTEVPDKTTATAVMDALEQAGKATDFAEAGIAWGNHEVTKAGKTTAEAHGLDQAPRVTWAELQDTREIRRVTLRLLGQDYATISRAAKRSGTSIQKWCENVLVTAATKEAK